MIAVPLHVSQQQELVLEDFFEAYTPGENLGSLFVQAQQQYIENVVNRIIYDPITIQEFTLIGDPSLKIGGYP